MRAIRALILLAALALPALAHADDPFAEFRIPAHGWRSGSASLGMSHFGSHTDQTSYESRHGDSSAGLNVSLLQAWDSDALRWTLSVGAMGNLLGESNDLRQDYGSSGSRVLNHRSQEATQDWSAYGALRTYPWRVPVGLNLTVQAQGAYGQSWRRDRQHDDQLPSPGAVYDLRSEGESHDGAHRLAASGSLGLGRVRDATVVMDVHVLEQRLLSIGALTRPLSPRARERLASLEVVAPSLADVLERPERRVWGEIDSILREDGALGERGLDPYAVFRAREPYRFAVARPAGWFVGPTFTLTHYGAHTAGSTDTWVHSIDPGPPPDTVDTYTHSGRRDSRSIDSAWIGGSGEYHLPLGWAWQLDASGSLSAPVRPGDLGLQVRALVSAVWLVADRWQATGSVQQSRSYYAPRTRREVYATPAWSVAMSGALAYYLEDHVMLRLGVEQTQVQIGVRRRPHSFERDNRVSLGVVCRFLGRIEAPGLFDAAQPGR